VGVKWLEHEADHSPPSHAMMELYFQSSIHFQGVVPKHRDSHTFSSTDNRLGAASMFGNSTPKFTS